MKMKILMGASGLQITVCLLMLFGLTQAANDSICYTKSCNQTAQLFSRMVDRTVDPCVNFQRYACGSRNNRPQNKYRLPDARKLIKSDDPIKPFRLLKTYISSCMDSDEKKNLETFSSILSKLGFDLELVDDHWHQKGSFDWINTTKVLVDSGLIDQIQSFIPKIEINASTTDSSKPMITLTEHLYTLRYYYNEGMESLVTKNKDTRDVRRKYFTHRYSYVKKFLSDFYNKSTHEINIKTFQADIFQPVFDLEKKLYDIFKVGHSQSLGLQTLAKEVPTIPWVEFVKTIVGASYNKTVSENETKVKSDVGKIKNWENLLRNTSSNVILTYIAYTIHLVYVTFTEQQLDKDLESCMKMNLVPEIIPLFFKSKVMLPKYKWKKGFVLQLFDRIRLTFIKMILDKRNWISRSFKLRGIEKLPKTAVVVVYNEAEVEMKKILDYYDDFELNDQQGHWSVRLQISKFRLKRQIERFQESVDISRIPSICTSSGCKPEIIDDVIYLPLSWLHNSDIKKYRPEYLNFMHVGWEIARMMATIWIGYPPVDDAQISSMCRESSNPFYTSYIAQSSISCTIDEYNTLEYTLNEVIIGRRGHCKEIIKPRTRSVGFEIIQHLFREWAYGGREIPQWKFLNSNDTLDQIFFTNAGLQYCLFSDDGKVSDYCLFAELSHNFPEFREAFSCKPAMNLK